MPTNHINQFQEYAQIGNALDLQAIRKTKMNKEQLQQEVIGTLNQIEAFTKALNNLVQSGRGPITRITDGSNSTVINDCILLLERFPELMGAKLKPMVNKLHKAYWKNAKFNADLKRKEEDAELMAKMPSVYKPKKKAAESVSKPVQYEEPCQTEEISNPEALLNLATN